MRPRVIIHNLISVDGRLNVGNPDVALYYELAAGLGADAMLCGSETMLAAFGDAAPADPLVDANPPDRPKPRLLVVDSKGRINCWDRIRAAPFWRSPVCLCSKETPSSYLDYLRDEGIESMVIGQGNVDLPLALEEVNRLYQVRTIRVDSGGKLNGALLEHRLVDELALLIAPCAIGADSPASLFVMQNSLDAQPALELQHVEALRNGHVWIRYRVK